MVSVKVSRDRRNGRYAHRDMNCLCKCGHRLGVHSAETSDGERPCFHGDDHPEEFCDCVRFVPAK